MAIARLYRDNHLHSHSAGWTYVAQFGDVAKIGFTVVGIRERLRSLARDRGPCILRAVLPGGRTREACLHVMFDSLRIAGVGELFRFAEPLTGFSAMYGVPPEIAMQIRDGDPIELP